ncbi:MAG: peptide chain release factor N(5)-glutamine methyltransferase [Bacilli bacterium]|nr:peptide chain release factor N(5)-glutamine methyltransferase [Bacilli bacterium]
MPKVRDVSKTSLEKGREYGIFSSDIRVLLAKELNLISPADVLLHMDDEIPAGSPYFSNFARLLKGEPVEYIVQQAKFLQYPLYVDNRVLIPRGETEELVANISELIYDYYDPRNYLVVADIGTGSGCIAIGLKSIGKNWIVAASDVDEGALEVAKKNFDDLGFRIQTLHGPSLKPYIDARMNLDIIVSNPPYILNKDEVQDSVKQYEPAKALYLNKDDSVYEDIFRDYKKVKKGTLLMCFEIGYDLEDYLTDLMDHYLEDYEYKFIKDLNGLTRFLFVFLH